MKKSSLGTIVAIIFMFTTIGLLYYFWSSSLKSAQNNAVPATTYVPVDVSGMKTEAAKLTSGAENNAGIPIPVPSTKLGKPNPFVAPE